MSSRSSAAVVSPPRATSDGVYRIRAALGQRRHAEFGDTDEHMRPPDDVGKAEEPGRGHEQQPADRIKAAYNRALEDEQRTGDLGGTLNTAQFTQAVVDRL